MMIASQQAAANQGRLALRKTTPRKKKKAESNTNENNKESPLQLFYFALY